MLSSLGHKAQGSTSADLKAKQEICSTDNWPCWFISWWRPASAAWRAAPPRQPLCWHHRPGGSNRWPGPAPTPSSPPRCSLPSSPSRAWPPPSSRPPSSRLPSPWPPPQSRPSCDITTETRAHRFKRNLKEHKEIKVPSKHHTYDSCHVRELTDLCARKLTQLDATLSMELNGCRTSWIAALSPYLPL